MEIPQHIRELFPKEHKTFLINFFRDCPKEVYEQITIREYPKNHKLISSYDDKRYVFLLLNGKLQALEERVVLIPYHFTELYPIDIVGDYEVFTNTQGHYVTLTTMEASLTLCMPAQIYENWMRKDSNALFLRTQMLMQVLSKQTQQQRQFLFMNTTQKLIFYLYDKTNNASLHSPYRIQETREQISAHIGCSVRQLNRILSSLEKENMLYIQHGKIALTLKQCELLKTQVVDYL